MYYYTQLDIEKAKNREVKKLINHKNDTNYIEHFKMIFKKDSIKLFLNEKNYITNYNVPSNPITKRIYLEWDDEINTADKWRSFDSQKELVALAKRTNIYPIGLRYEMVNGKLVYNKEYIERITQDILENLMLNINYFKKLNQEKFNRSLNKIMMLKKNNGLKEVKDLKEYMGAKGIYILVLDQYKQIYVGQSKRDIVDRIISHWKKHIELENILVGKTNKTKISIDAFGMLDTTRIFIENIDPTYYNNSMKIDEREEYLINSVPEEYLANKIGGGIRLGDVESLDKFITTYKHRDLENNIKK